MTARHAAPKEGYDFPAKKEYRRRLLATIERETTASSRKTSSVLFLPGRLGGEAQSLLDLGFKAENLLACDYQRKSLMIFREKFPQIPAFHGTFGAAGKYLRGDRVFDIVLGDTCGGRSLVMLDQFEAWKPKRGRYNGLLAEDVIMSATLSKGHIPVSQIIHKYGPELLAAGTQYNSKLAMCVALGVNKFTTLDEWEYTSPGGTMMQVTIGRRKNAGNAGL